MGPTAMIGNVFNNCHHCFDYILCRMGADCKKLVKLFKEFFTDILKPIIEEAIDKVKMLVKMRLKESKISFNKYLFNKYLFK